MLPKLIIIGAMNCGTTSLHYYLNLHPEIMMSKEKELDFFVKELNYKLGIDWYKSNFKNTRARIRGESSPNYTKYPKYKGVPQRIFKHIPDIKLIYLIRNPIDRIISHYQHNLSKGRENRTLEDALSDITRNHYVNCSKYYMQLSRYLKYFPKKNIFIIKTEDLLTKRKPVLSNLFRFLEVDHQFYNNKFNKVLHQTKDKNLDAESSVTLPVIDSIKNAIFSSNAKALKFNIELRSKIIEVLADDLNKLEVMTGMNLGDWKN